MPPKIVAIEPYYGESHKEFLDNLIKHSSCNFELVTLSPHRWQWRMRTAALELRDEIVEKSKGADILFASDYLDLPSLIGFAPTELGKIKKVMYFHENQLTYPVQESKNRDIHFGITNIMSCHAADEAWFNSRWHLSDFQREVNHLAKKLRDGKSLKSKDLASKCHVVPLGVNLSSTHPQTEIKEAETKSENKKLRILWNHRWEYDKNPDEFFEVMADIQEMGYDFELSVCGYSFVRHPEIFDKLPEMFGDKLIHCGWLDSKEEYFQQLTQADVVVSTAIHEFFGISVVEAIHFNCYPLLPNRLSYPEIIPENLHENHLWNDKCDLKRKLIELISSSTSELKSIAASVNQYDWSHRIKDFDQRFFKIAETQ